MLWDSTATTPELVPVPDWHKQLLDERLDEYRRDGDSGRPWQKVMDEIEAELDRPRG